MDSINIHDAKTHLSRLLGRVALLGFMADVVSVPDDFDTMGTGEIAALFGGNSDEAK